MFFTQSGKIIKLNAQNKMGSQFCVSHIPLAPEIMGNIDEGYFKIFFFFFWMGGRGIRLRGLMQGRWWAVIWFRIRWNVSCLELIDRWLGSTAKNTKFSRKDLKGLFPFTYKTDLQSAYILVLILVNWLWQPSRWLTSV